MEIHRFAYLYIEINHKLKWNEIKKFFDSASHWVGTFQKVSVWKLFDVFSAIICQTVKTWHHLKSTVWCIFAWHQVNTYTQHTHMNTHTAHLKKIYGSKDSEKMAKTNGKRHGISKSVIFSLIAASLDVFFFSLLVWMFRISAENIPKCSAIVSAMEFCCCCCCHWFSLLHSFSCVDSRRSRLTKPTIYFWFATKTLKNV